jgi:metal-responsive CopG/Arc/MetJ family transcriptional regulator
MKTAISIPDALFEEAEKAAKDLGLSRSKFIQTAVEDFLRRRRDAEVTGSIKRYVEKHGADTSQEDEAWLAHSRKMLRDVEWEE